MSPGNNFNSWKVFFLLKKKSQIYPRNYASLLSLLLLDMFLLTQYLPLSLFWKLEKHRLRITTIFWSCIAADLYLWRLIIVHTQNSTKKVLPCSETWRARIHLFQNVSCVNANNFKHFHFMVGREGVVSLVLHYTLHRKHI